VQSLTRHTADADVRTALEGASADADADVRAYARRALAL